MRNRREALRIAALWAAWLTLLMLFSCLARRLAPIEGESFISSLFHFDAGWYQEIARHGYFDPAATAFFPLYPLMVRVLSYPLLGNYRLAALVISWISLLGALLYLQRLASSLENPEAAFRSCLYLLVFPTAIILAVGYSESLFLLCAVASFYHARRSGWTAAGAWAGAACLARPTGLAVCAAIALEALRRSGWRLSGLRPRMAAVLLGPLGLVAYMVYLQADFGDFLIFSKAHQSWGRSFNPWGIFRSLGNVFSHRDLLSAETAFLLLILAFLALTVLIFVRYGAPLGIMSLLSLLFPLLISPKTEPTMSIARMVLVIYPAFILMGRWGRNRDLERAYLVVSTLGLAYFTICFLQLRFLF